METRVPELFGVILTFLGLSLLFVSARVIIRCRRGSAGKGGFWIDDALIMAAEVTVIGCSISKLMGIPYGSGRHIHDLPESVLAQIDKMLMVWYIAQVCYFMTVGLIKFSILFFYLRLGNELKTYVLWAMGLVGATTIATVLAAIFQCTPISHFWTPHGPGTCINVITYGLATSAVSIVSDIIIYILPMRTLWNVQLPKRQRLGLILVFAVGGFVVLTGILRLHSLTLMRFTEDPTWVNVPVQLWSLVELNVAIICASLPSLKPLFARMVGLRGNTSQGPPTPLKEYPSGNSDSGFQRSRGKPAGRNYWDSQLETQVIAGHAATVSGSPEDIEVENNEKLRNGEITKTTRVSIVTTRSNSESESSENVNTSTRQKEEEDVQRSEVV